MRFIVDSMLGKLAKRLRMLGYDATYDAKLDDREILKISRDEDRFIVTRDTQLSKVRGAKVFLIISTDPEKQMDELKKLAKIMKDRKLLFTRCTECNTPVKAISKDEAKAFVPEYVHRTVEHFSFCPGCKRVYWKGTHIDHLQKELKNI